MYSICLHTSLIWQRLQQLSTNNNPLAGLSALEGLSPSKADAQFIFALVLGQGLLLGGGLGASYLFSTPPTVAALDQTGLMQTGLLSAAVIGKKLDGA